MTIIVTKNDQQTVKVTETTVPNENFLQSFIYDNPDTIPLYEISQDIRAFVFAREFATDSGPIDAVAIDGEGNLYVIETKLYQNPDKRKVVAQVLDYGSALWKQRNNFESFLENVNKHTQKRFGMDLQDKLAEFLAEDREDTQKIIDNLKSNLEDGSFKFVVLMDTIHDSLKDLIHYINKNSQFDIYAVEYKFYEHDQYQIIIPKLYGSDQEKSVNIRKKVSSIGKSQFGHRKGTQAARIDELLIEGTTPEIAAKEVGSTASRVRNHIQHLRKNKDIPVIEENGKFKVSPEWLRNNPEDQP